MNQLLKNLKSGAGSKPETKPTNYAELNPNPNSRSLEQKSFSRSRTNVEEKGVDKDMTNMKAEIDKMRQSEIIVLDENTKSHFREFIHKNSDKFVRRPSNKEIVSPEHAEPKKTTSPSPQLGSLGIAKKLKSGFATNKDSNETVNEKTVSNERIEKELSKKSSSEDSKNTTQPSGNQGNENDKKPPNPQTTQNPLKIPNFTNLEQKVTQNSNADDAKKLEVDKPTTDKSAVDKPVVKKPAFGLLARLRELKEKEAKENPENEKSNTSEINSSKNPLVGAKVDKEKENANQSDNKDPLNPPELIRGESAKKSTFAKIVEKFVPKKTEKEGAANDFKRVNSIKQKLLEEEAVTTDISDKFDENRLKRFKQKAHLTLNHPEFSRWATFYVLSMLVLILGDISLIIVETEPSLGLPNLWVQIARYLWPIYFIDFMARVFIYDAFDETFWEFVTRKKDIGIMIDLLALIYSSMEILWYMIGNYSTLPILVKMMRVFVVGRLLRGFRLPIFNKGVDILQQGLNKSRKPLGILAFFAVLSVLAIASLVYFAESISLPGDDSIHQIDNLPMALWWAIITVTTVGYGDVVPQSVAGKIIASFSLLFGVLLLSLPVAIIGNQFQEQYLKDLQLNTQRERQLARENMNKIESIEEKEIYKMIVKLNDLEEVNEKIESYLKENQFLYRSITRDALNLINKIELSNRQLHDVKSKEMKLKEILKSIRKQILIQRSKKSD